MKKTVVIVFFLLATALGASMAWSTEAAVPEDLLSRIKILTSGQYAGRGAGTPEGEAAVDVLVSWYREAGLEPAFGASYTQEFPLSGQGWTGDPLAGKTSRNVGGILRGAGLLADHFIVVGAHHDHLGRLDVSLMGSGPASPRTYYAGANDNASGVTVVFELVKLLKADQTDSRRSVLFVNFGGEEVGLQGSKYFVDHCPIPLDMIDAMVNFDTVGQMADHRLYVSGVGTSPRFPSLAQNANTEGLTLSLAEGGFSGSDHMSFDSHGVPVLFLFGGPYRQYNTVADLPDVINSQGLAEIADFSSRLIGELRDWDQDFPWVEVVQDTLPEVNGPQNKDTWFGSLPDFAEHVPGYKLGGVFDGSPAAAAGLLKGDVLVKLGGRDITDLASFTTALRSHDPGDLVEVTVLREGNSLNFTVVLGDRKLRK